MYWVVVKEWINVRNSIEIHTIIDLKQPLYSYGSYPMLFLVDLVSS